MSKTTDILAIGGSAGSMPVLMQIIESLPATFHFAVVIVIHRLKNVESEMDRILGTNTSLLIQEPEDKEPIQAGHIYLAPQNYHLLIEEDKSFSLDYSELVNFSRPSIDVTFQSIAGVYYQRAAGIILSGANDDGAQGLHSILHRGGTGIIQAPETARYPAMPQSAININKKALVLSPEAIVHYIAEHLTR